jgi:outer membrane protein assembly factor BamD
MIAIKQIEIGRFYARRGEHGAAAQRYQEVLMRHSNTIAVPEAMYRLIEVHINLDSRDNAYKYYQMLNTSYPNSIWAQRSVKFMPSNYNVQTTTKYRTKALVIPGEDTGFYSN